MQSLIIHLFGAQYGGGKEKRIDLYPTLRYQYIYDCIRIGI